MKIVLRIRIEVFLKHTQSHCEIYKVGFKELECERTFRVYGLTSPIHMHFSKNILKTQLVRSKIVISISFDNIVTTYNNCQPNFCKWVC